MPRSDRSKESGIGFVKPKKNKLSFVASRLCATRELAFRNGIIQKRTMELIMANKELTFQNGETERRAAELIIANTELAFQNGEKEKRAAELIIANRELAFQNIEKEKRAAELIIANAELSHQNVEKEKRAAELIVANTELAFQNEEKEKRAAELIIANRELAFQNNEKEKRAAELIAVNAELSYGNNEKEKRAAELVIVNKELLFEKGEKESRAAELVVANRELAFQNEEKERRAAELYIANKELLFQNGEKERRAAELIFANQELAFQNNEKEKRAAELIIANNELKKAEEVIRILNQEDMRRLNEELEQKVIMRTAQLELANKELEAFSYSVSHDLRAPLRAVNGFARMLQEDYNSKFDDEGRRLLGIVRTNAKKMGVLIDDLLAFSRLGKKDINKSVVNMTDLAQSTVDELNISTENKAEMVIESLHPVLADKTLMSQVWINLVSNAIKYSSKTDSPRITIVSEKKNGELVYSVSDNGVGYDMQYAHKLFGVFQRLHAAEEFEGTGVGLALVHRIVSRHGGRVWANAQIGKGATFYFSLPDERAALNQ